MKRGEDNKKQREKGVKAIKIWNTKNATNGK
jgi:hypothetical protein